MGESGSAAADQQAALKSDDARAAWPSLVKYNNPSVVTTKDSASLSQHKDKLKSVCTACTAFKYICASVSLFFLYIYIFVAESLIHEK